MVTVTIKETK